MARNSRDGYGLGTGGPIPALAPQPIIATRVPATTDLSYELGSIWVNTTTNQAWTLTSVAAGSATWAISSPGASDVDTINVLSPVAGNITIDGGTNITDVNAGNTVTLNLDPAITLATSVTSPLYTAGAGVDANLTAPAGQDIILTMGDAAGANKVSFQTNAAAEVFSIDSTGTAAYAGLTVAGAFTQTAGIANIGADATANAVNIGTGAAAKPVTIGSVTGASSLDLLAGTGNFSLEGNVATTYAISNVGVNTGQVDIAGGTGARTINIGGGGTGAKTINIGAAASADVITIGDATGAGSLDLVCGTGNFSLEGNVATTYAISNTGANTGQVDIAGGTGARTINLGLGGTGIKTINIGTAATADVISIGDSTGAGSLALDAGSGGFSLDSTGTSNITVTSASLDLSLQGVGCAVRMTSTETENDAIYIEASAANGGVEINAGTGGIRIGDEADCTGLTFGNIAPTASRNITIGSGTVVTAAVTDDISIGDGGATTNASSIKHVDINNGGVTLGEVNTYIACGAVTSGTHLTEICTGNVTAGTATLDIATGTGAQTLQIANGAGAKTVTLGSTNTTSSLTLQSGTGDITMTGTVKEIDAEFLSRSGDDITFQASPVMQSALTTGAAPTGATGDVNLMCCQEGIIMEQFIIGAGQTIIAPRMSTNGLLVSLDLTATKGAEYNFGAARNNSRHAFTIGTSAAFFFELQYRINDMDGADPYIFGFRKVEANNGTWTAYSDYATMGMIASTSATNIVLATELNSGGTTITNTTDAWGGDGSVNTLRVLVSSTGVVTYTINGVAPSVTAAFTFDNADVVVPFAHFVHSASPTEVDLVSMKIGFQA